ncbi:MAG: hypothetical protein GY698_16725, partial [Actinomycetia bacterium]|nr:hypothetical protein [Actinomycetes bacterium]
MSAPEAVDILDRLAASGVDACVGGGWAVDALLTQQTRVHGDLDLWLPANQFDSAVNAFVETGVDRLFPWGDDRPWNFVLHDGATRRVDLHLYEAVGQHLHYGGIETGETFPAEALTGHGQIADRAVRCESPHWAIKWHTGYPARPEDQADVALLCQAFDIDLPDGFHRSHHSAPRSPISRATPDPDRR